MGCVQDREPLDEPPHGPEVPIDIQSEVQSHADSLIPYSEDDPTDIKIVKIKERWRMNYRNILSFMKDLRFCFMICQSIESCLPQDDTYDYTSVESLMTTLNKNNISESCFCTCMPP